MQDENFVWLDRRWSEPGWEQVFRLCLTGWLPAEDVTTGLCAGVIERCVDDPLHCVNLTEKGIALVEVGEISRTQENCALIAEVLRVRGFDETWFVDSGYGCKVLTTKANAFDFNYKSSILRALGISGRR